MKIMHYYRDRNNVILLAIIYAFNIGYKQLIGLVYPNIVNERNLHVNAFACIQ